MKKQLVGLLICSVALAGCMQPQNRTQQGAMIGTGVGAAVGAGLGQVIAKDTKGTLIGAAIGAGVGGLAGGAFGRYMDNQEASMRQQLAGVEAANVQRNADMLAVTFKSDFLFDVNSASLKPGSFDEIARVAGVLNQYPQTNILIAGHTDATGSDAYNQQLSQRRAEAVKAALVGQGVSPMRMNTVGYGEGRPLADNNSEAGRQMNRRVEITITPTQQAPAYTQ